ncbi:MAG: alpha-glucuronidase family glycosyl hydrolase, partial [Abditibacteriaceae bacterium]
MAQRCSAQTSDNTAQRPTGIVQVDLSKANVEGGKSAPATAEAVSVNYKGQNEAGIKLVMQHRVAYNSVGFPVNSVNAKEYNTLQFKVRFDTATGDPTSFGVWIFNKGGNWAATSFLGHAKDLGNGWYQFSWDMVNQPDNRIIDMSNLTGISIRYGFENVPEGKTDTLTVIDMKLVSGLSVRTGDPELYKGWDKYISSYTPDYSDSSKYLLPPTTGRIATPLALTVDGKPFSKIVVPMGASQPLTLAGNELQHWLKEISEANISIIPTLDKGNGTRVLLGRQFAAGKFDKDIAALGDSDGFAVRTQGKNIYIFGATDKGTLNGVFAFLENNTDIIWPRELQELGAVFSKNLNVDAVWANAQEIPATRLRGWGIGVRDEANIWAVRNRNNYSNPEGTLVKENAEQLRALGNHIQFGGGHGISGFLGKNPDFYP